MGTTPTTQHATLIGFSPPLVNAEGAGLRLHFSDRAPLDVAASNGLLASLRDALRLVVQPSPKAGIRPAHKLAPGHAATYRRIIAAVHAGTPWEPAAKAEGVKACNVKMWWARQQKRNAARKPGEPITKPSGALL